MTDEHWRDDDLLTGPQVCERRGFAYTSWHNLVVRGLVPQAAVPIDPRQPQNRQSRKWRWSTVKDFELPGRGTRTDTWLRQCPDCPFYGSAVEFAAHRASVHGGGD